LYPYFSECYAILLKNLVKIKLKKSPKKSGLSSKKENKFKTF